MVNDAYVNIMYGESQVEKWETIHAIQILFAVRCHDLRHTFCTLLYDAEIDLETSRVLMGHEDVKLTLSIYTHLRETRKKVSYDKMRSFFDEIL